MEYYSTNWSTYFLFVLLRLNHTHLLLSLVCLWLFLSILRSMTQLRERYKYFSYSLCPITSTDSPIINVCSVMSNSLWPHGQQAIRLLYQWNFPGKNDGIGDSEIKPTSLHLLHCQMDSLPLCHLGRQIDLGNDNSSCFFNFFFPCCLTELLDKIVNCFSAYGKFSAKLTHIRAGLRTGSLNSHLRPLFKIKNHNCLVNKRWSSGQGREHQWCGTCK